MFSRCSRPGAVGSTLDAVALKAPLVTPVLGAVGGATFQVGLPDDCAPPAVGAGPLPVPGAYRPSFRSTAMRSYSARVTGSGLNLSVMAPLSSSQPFSVQPAMRVSSMSLSCEARRLASFCSSLSGVTMSIKSVRDLIAGVRPPLISMTNSLTKPPSLPKALTKSAWA